MADTAANRVKIQKKSGEEIDEVGEFAFTLKVEDTADATRTAERKFTLKVEEDLAMNFYTVADNKDGRKEWKLVQEKDEDGDDVPITVPPKGRLLAVVIGHAESYRWSIDGLEIVCSADSCAVENDHIKLYKDMDLEPQGLPPHHQSIVTEAKESFIGQDPKSVTISAAQDYGDPVSKTISSITFQQEPCKIPITVSGSAKAYVDADGDYEATFAVSGGKAPYRYMLDTTKTWTAIEGSIITIKENAPVGVVTIGNLAEDVILERTIVVTDSCPAVGMERWFETPLIVARRAFDVPIDRVSDLRIKVDLQGVNDTSSDGAYSEDTTYLLVMVRSDGEELGRFYFDLDRCGDGGAPSNCEDVRTIEMVSDSGDPTLTEIDEITIQFHDDECFLCGDLDCDLITIDLMTNHWETRYSDDKSEGGYGNNDDVVEDEWGPIQDLIPKIKEQKGVSTPQEIWTYRNTAAEG